MLNKIGKILNEYEKIDIYKEFITSCKKVF